MEYLKRKWVYAKGVNVSPEKKKEDPGWVFDAMTLAALRLTEEEYDYIFKPATEEEKDILCEPLINPDTTYTQRKEFLIVYNKYMEMYKYYVPPVIKKRWLPEKIRFYRNKLIRSRIYIHVFGNAHLADERIRRDILRNIESEEASNLS